MIDLDEAERIGKAAGDHNWCAIIPSNDIDPKTFAYGYGAIVAVPGPGECVSIIVKVDDFDDQSDALRFIAFARNNWQAMVDRIRQLEAEQVKWMAVTWPLEEWMGGRITEQELRESAARALHELAKPIMPLSGTTVDKPSS